MTWLALILCWLPPGWSYGNASDSPLSFPVFRPEQQCSGEDVYRYTFKSADQIFADGFESGDVSAWGVPAAVLGPIVAACPGRSSIQLPSAGLWEVSWQRRRDGRLVASGRYFETWDCWPHCDHRPEEHYAGGALLWCNGFEAPESRFPHTNTRNVARCHDKLPPLCFGEADLRAGETLEECLGRLY